MESASSNFGLGQALFVSWLCLSPLLVIGLGVLLFRSSKRLKLVKAEAESIKNRIFEIERDTQYSIREAWLGKLGKLTFANEVEVEIKFVYPLLLYLGYENNDFSIRYKVIIQAGREQLQKEADWVVWRRHENAAKVVLIIEAKAPLQPLDNTVQNQGRSYAFSMNAPKYVLTNGIDFMIYERGIEFDRCSLNVPVRDLATQWSEVIALIGAQSKQ